MCNHASGKWEMIGAVHAPKKSECGAKPPGMSDEAVCDSSTKEWKEIVQIDVPSPGFKTCEGQPPNVKYPVCNVETGEWFPLDDELASDIMAADGMPVVPEAAAETVDAVADAAIAEGKDPDLAV